MYYLDSIPWWVWLLPTPFIIGVVAWFFGPLILRLWFALPTKVQAGLAIIFTIGLAYLFGRGQGNRAAREMQKQRDAHAVQTRERIHREVQTLNEPDVDKRLNRWMRD